MENDYFIIFEELSDKRKKFIIPAKCIRHFKPETTDYKGKKFIATIEDGNRVIMKIGLIHDVSSEFAKII